MKITIRSGLLILHSNTMFFNEEVLLILPELNMLSPPQFTTVEPDDVYSLELPGQN
jgi:hypothetical protein